MKSHLKLSGIIQQKNERNLTLRNKIYRQVFNRRWIKENLPENWVQRYWPVLRVAVPVTVLSMLATGAMAYLAIEANRQREFAQIQTILDLL